jgi:hypothetical protein
VDTGALAPRSAPGEPALGDTTLEPGPRGPVATVDRSPRATTAPATAARPSPAPVGGVTVPSTTASPSTASTSSPAPATVASAEVASTAASAPAAAAEHAHEEAPAAPRWPFAAGERLTYDVRFGSIKVGSAQMEVRGGEEVRGRAAYHVVFSVNGGRGPFRVQDHYESWFDARSLESLRYVQNIDQGPYERDRRFEIFPDRQRYAETGKPEQPSVASPLDDASFFYFLRTVPLEVGKTYVFDRYFRPDRNPVRVVVLRRERVTVPAGTFDAVVVQPIIKTPGIFSEGGRAEVWFATDSTRRVLQIRTRLKFGTLNLHLRAASPRGN